MYHNKKDAREAEEHFNLIHKNKEVPEDIAEYRLNSGTQRLLDIIVEAGLTQGTGEARRLIRQGGVKINGETILDELMEIHPSDKFEKILKVGKRKFLKIISK